MSAPLARFEPSSRWDPAFAAASPCFESVREAAAGFAAFDAFPTVEEVNRVLGPRAGVRFELQEKKKRRRRRRAESVDVCSLYDGRITLDGVVPTRAESYHDLFNALIWASFPRAKRTLHRRQFEAASTRIGGPTRRLPGTRTRAEDSLTMLDEGGELWLYPSSDAADAAGAPDADAGGRRLVFGHALLEHAQAGLEGARPRRLPLVVEACDGPLEALRVAVDEALTAYLVAGGC